MMPFSPKIKRFTPSSRQGFISFQGAQLIFAVVLLFIFIAVFPRFFSHNEKFIPLNQKVDSFSGFDVNGETVSFQNLKGKLNLVAFGASWCSVCIKNINDVENLYQEHNNQDFKVIYIAVENSLENMRQFKNRYSLSFPMILQNKEIARQFNSPDAVPSYFILDSTGVILHKSLGRIPRSEVRTFLQKIQAHQ